MEKGSFIISLDLELMWGVRDVTTKEVYGDSILGVKKAMPRMLNLFDKHDILGTFATVGFLFCQNKKELLENIPKKVPLYNNSEMSPYNTLDEIGEDEESDPFYFGYSLIESLKNTNHEISSHTFSHYYCLEEGQNKETFKVDLVKAIEIAKEKEIEIQSIIFPRNQVNSEYIEICKENGISSFRGTEKAWFYKSERLNDESLLKRLFRLMDSYINISGLNIYTYDEVASSYPFNIPSSAFLRPYNKRLAFLDGWRVKRIKRAMTKAAKENKIYHLWWHPHNFGSNQDANFRILEQILSHYSVLNKKYGFKSVTMTNLSNQLL